MKLKPTPFRGHPEIRHPELGGKATRGKIRLIARMGMKEIDPAHPFARYRKSADRFRRYSCSELTKLAGKGFCGPSPSVMVGSASLQLAWSRYYFDVALELPEGEDRRRVVEFASKLSDACTKNLRGARDLCALEAEARAATTMTDPAKQLEDGLTIVAGDWIETVHEKEKNK